MQRIILDEMAVGGGFDLGGKGNALARLGRAGLPIPRWLAVPPPDLLRAIGLSALETPAYPALRASLAQALQEGLASIAPAGDWLAVRSSAADEDGAEHAFAGLLESYLFVPPARVMDFVEAVWRSAASPAVLAYCREKQLSPGASWPTVLVQCMVNAEASGVSFSADPMSGEAGVTVISAVYGLGSALVSGECNADTAYLLPDGAILQYRTALKTVIHQPGAEGEVQAVPCPPELAERPVLNEHQLSEIAHLTRFVAQCCAQPQDIEWAIADQRLFLLQARPITTPIANEARALPREVRRWDNATVAESWSGPVSPLTFSVASRLLGATYQALSEETCVKKSKITDGTSLSKELLGRWQGQLYLSTDRLEAWWSIAPSLPYLLAQWRANAPLSGRMKRAILAQGGRLLLNALALPFLNWGWTRAVTHLLRTCPAEPASAALLLVRQRRLLAFIQREWRIPALNNYLAASAYEWVSGWLGARLPEAAEAWWQTGDAPRDSVSRNLTARLSDLAALARQDSALLNDLRAGRLPLLPPDQPFARAWQDYLSRYGERSPADLSMESASFQENPAPLLQTIAALAAGTEQPSPSAQSSQQEVKPWRIGSLPLPWPEKLVLSAVIRYARGQLARRETLRFQVTRVTARLRSLLKQSGALLADAKVLQTPEQVQWLDLTEVDELLTALSSPEAPSRTWMLDWQTRIAQRIAEEAQWANLPPLPGRLISYGRLCLGEGEASRPEGEWAQGAACAPGEAEGVVKRWQAGAPLALAEYRDAILLAHHGDPALVTLFPLLKGVICEHGGPLSHLAIVARELQLPAVMGVPGAMGWLDTGDRVRLDGRMGWIRKLSIAD